MELVRAVGNLDANKLNGGTVRTYLHRCVDGSMQKFICRTPRFYPADEGDEPEPPSPTTDFASARLEEVLGRLPPEDRGLLTARFGVGRKKETLSQIARRLGLSVSAVKKRERAALQRAARASESA